MLRSNSDMGWKRNPLGDNLTTLPNFEGGAMDQCTDIIIVHVVYVACF